MAAPAGTPSDRARVRCGDSGRGSNVQPAAVSSASTTRGELDELLGAGPDAEPQRARPAGRREGAGAADRRRRTGDLRPRRRGRASVAGWTRSSRRRPEEPERQVEPVEADPAHVATTARDASARTRSTMSSIAARCLRRQRHRDEQASPGHVRAGPARSASARRHPGRRPVSRSQASRSVAQHLEGPLLLAPADDVDRLVLERLVCLEEVLDLDEAVRPDLLEPLDVLLVGVADGDAQHLEVEALLVAHLQPADRARPDVAAGEGRLVDDQQRVGVVAVAAAGPLDEAVVEVVEDGAGQHAIEPEDVRLLVVLVLVARPARDLDDDLDDVGKRTGRLHPVSLVRHACHRPVRRLSRSDAQGGSEHVKRAHPKVRERARGRPTRPAGRIRAAGPSRCRGAPRSASPARFGRSGRSS